MSIYPPEFTVKQLIQDCEKPSLHDGLPFADSFPRKNRQIDIKKLNARLRELPVQEIRDRKHRLELFYQEMLLTARANDKRIRFDHLLMELAHHKIIDDKALRLEEFLKRSARVGVVKGEVNRKFVGLIASAVYYRQRYLEKQESRRASRMFTVPDLPTIVVQDEDDSSRTSSRMGSLRGRPTLTLTIPPKDEAVIVSGSDARVSPTSPGLRNRGDSFSPSTSPTRPQISPISTRPSFQSQRSLQISPTISSFRSSASLPSSPLDEIGDPLTPDGASTRGMLPRRSGSTNAGADGYVRRSLSPMAGPHQQQGRLSAERAADGAMTRRNTASSGGGGSDVLDAFEASAWGESMRRSVTSRRSTRASSGGNSGGSGGR